MRSDVNFADVGGGKRPAAAFDRAFERLLSCKQATRCQVLRGYPSFQFDIFSKLYGSVDIFWCLERDGTGFR